MPSINLSCYLSDEEFLRYAKDKEEINKEIRTKLKEILNGGVEDGSEIEG